MYICAMMSEDGLVWLIYTERPCTPKYACQVRFLLNYLSVRREIRKHCNHIFVLTGFLSFLRILVLLIILFAAKRFTQDELHVLHVAALNMNMRFGNPTGANFLLERRSSAPASNHESIIQPPHSFETSLFKPHRRCRGRRFNSNSLSDLRHHLPQPYLHNPLPAVKALLLKRLTQGRPLYQKPLNPP